MAREKEHWQINTEKLAAEILEAAKRAQSEEDLKIPVEQQLQKAFVQMGVDVDIVRYEDAVPGRTSFRGRADAVYGFLTIEYKSPGKLSSAGSVDEACEQLQRYLQQRAGAFGQQEEDFLEKAVGVATDGYRIFFVRFTKTATALQPPIPEPTEGELFPGGPAARGFQVLGPYPVSRSSLASLLIYVRAAARRPLTPSDLATVFGPDGEVARSAVSELYSAAMRAQRRKQSSRTKTFFKEWDRIFGVVYGEDLEKAEKSADETAKLYRMPGGARLKQLLFGIHTYYAFLMKIMAVELVSLQQDSTVQSFVQGLAEMDDRELRARLSHLESGADFSSRGIANFLEADFFSWYLDAWEPKVANVFRDIVRALADFEPATPVLEPEWTRDLLQKLYEVIVPKELRHDLGEYYTPDWLAGYVVDRSGYTGKLGSRFLDPACGSGTFVVQAIHRAIKEAERKGTKPTEAGRHILNNIVGFDLNPLAVLASRTNYLIAFSRFIPHVRPISIPIYLCDSVLAPISYVEKGMLPFEDIVAFRTTKADYIFPIAIQEKAHIDKFTSMVDESIRGKHEPDQFRRRIENEFKLSGKGIDLLTQVYRQIKELDDEGENGIWARYIKNAFAPAYVGKFDYVVGNPPWIRWGYLSADYRERTLELWHRYGLFSLTGHETRLGAGEKDFSMLFTYACMDHYVTKGGTLAFVITMEVFKSKGAGEGFRAFRLKHCHTPFKILRMEDMVHLQPFHAANKTCVFTARKGEATDYPVEVLEWTRKRGVGRIPPEWTLKEVRAKCSIRKLQGQPIDPRKRTSSWQTAEPGAMKALGRMQGQNPYKAHLGARVEPYGVFWLKIKEVRPDGRIVVENMHDRGKREIKPVTQSIESRLVFPAVSGGDITRFGIKSSVFLLVSQDPKKRQPHSEDWLISKAPLTHAYLKQFEGVLRSRGSRVVREFAEKTEFYAMYGIGEYSFAKYRVTWKRMASKLVAVVLSSQRTELGQKPVISTDTTSFFALDNKEEAHYLCAILNSDLADGFIRSFSSGGRGFGAPSVMENLAIPLFSPKDKSHKRLADLSEKCHGRVAKERSVDREQKEINTLVRELWNIR